MKILITGAAGLLGIELTKQLLDAGHEVDAIDNFYTSSSNNIKQLVLYSLVSNHGTPLAFATFGFATTENIWFLLRLV